jgi:ribosomal protein S18 acetylase RimI-like enzyme
MAVQVRRIRSGEGRLLRNERLAALADSPLAFESTFDEESNRPDEAWETAKAARSEGVASANFVAEGEAGVVGLIGAYRSDEEPETVELISMWVAPHARGQGLGAHLVERVVEGAAGAKATRVALWVTRGNDPAIALYRRTGFSFTAASKAHASHPCREELRMARELVGVQGG